MKHIGRCPFCGWDVTVDDIVEVGYCPRCKEMVQTETSQQLDMLDDDLLYEIDKEQREEDLQDKYEADMDELYD